MIPTTSTPRIYRPLEDGLRAAGYCLDGYKSCLHGLFMTADGLVLVAANPDPRQPGEAILVTDENLAQIVDEARAARGSGVVSEDDAPHLFPTGYQDFLRALGGFAAQHGWKHLRLVVLGDYAILHYTGSAGRQSLALDRDAVYILLNEAFARRRSSDGPIPPFSNALFGACAPTLDVMDISYHPPHEGGEKCGRDDNHYADDLDVLGYVLESREASDTCIVAVEGGYLLVYIAPSGQQEVYTVEMGELPRLRHEASRHKPARHAPATRISLHAIGHYLDEQKAAGILMQQLSISDWALDYAGLGEAFSASEFVVRVQERLMLPAPPAAPAPSRFRLFRR